MFYIQKWQSADLLKLKLFANFVSGTGGCRFAICCFCKIKIYCYRYVKTILASGYDALSASGCARNLRS